MTARRLSGKEAAEARKAAARRGAEAVRALLDRAPRLVVILATDDEAALAYARAKEKAARAVEIEVELADVGRSTAEILDRLSAWAVDDTVDGILIETPVAAGVDLRALQDAIPAAKDVDGASTWSLGALFAGRPGFAPATASAAMALLDAHEVPLSGRRVVVVGRSLVVGRPLAQLLLARNATVTLCHSQTRDLASVTREADVLCVAVGRPGVVTGDMVKPGAAVIDIGTNVVDGKLIGDVDFDSAAAVAGAVSPVPGGVGPLTTAILLENVARAAQVRAKRGAL